LDRVRDMAVFSGFIGAGEWMITLLSALATRALNTRFLAAPAPSTRLATPDRLGVLAAREREITAVAAEGPRTTRSPSSRTSARRPSAPMCTAP